MLRPHHDRQIGISDIAVMMKLKFVGKFRHHSRRNLYHCERISLKGTSCQPRQGCQVYGSFCSSTSVPRTCPGITVRNWPRIIFRVVYGMVAVHLQL